MRLPGNPDQRLGVASVVWTLVVWLPRIGIIPVTNAWDLARIAGSIGLGLLAGYVLFRSGPARNTVLWSFGVWSIVVWGRSLWNYWTLDNPLDLRLVHTVLAAGFFYLAARAFAATRSGPIPEPNQSDGDQQREGETSALS